MKDSKFYPNDGKKPSREKRRRPSRHESAATGRIKITVFACTMVVFCIIGLILPLRPAISENEKRELSKFPTLTAKAFFSGEYFSDISTWYADTFPFRETLIGWSNGLRNMFGFKGEQVIGKIETGDDIVTGEHTEDPNVIPVFGDDTSSVQTSTTAAATDSPDNPVSSDPADITSSPGITSSVPADTTQKPEDTTQKPAETTQKPAETTQTPSETTQQATTGEGEKVGSVYVKGDTIYEFSYYVKAYSDRYAAAMNTVAADLEGKASVYSIIVPKAFGFYLTEKELKKFSLPNESDMINACYSQMNGTVNKVGIYAYLDTKKDEYIFFRTDHHWTALGAYYAYQCYCAKKGVTPKALSSWTSLDIPGFLGTLYTDAKQPAAAAKNPDTVTVWYPNSTNKLTFWDKNDTKTSWSVITNTSKWATSSRYNAFVGGDNPYSEIVNPTLSDGSACVVVKDSFGNAFIPFLVDDYQYVYIVDFRYYSYHDSGTLQDLVINKNIQDVIFVNNVTTVNSSYLVPLIEKLITKKN